jgi:hypothetical protein
MRLLAMTLLLGGCVDSVKCHEPVAWPVCAGATAEPGATGTPPAITSLMLPTCAFVDSPSVSGTIAIADPDGDAALIKSSLYVGVRLAEVETMLPAGHMGNFAGTFLVAVPMATPGAYDVRVKVVDRAGGQSAPLCNTITMLQ